MVHIVAGQLGGYLAHDDAGHQGHAGHVAADPKLAVGDVLIADADIALGVLVDDGVELFHLEPLRIELADRLAVCQHMAEIKGIERNDSIFARQT